MLYLKHMKTYTKFKKEILKDKELERLYKESEPEFLIVQKIIEQRIKKGLTQAKLARRAGTQQSAIARLESGTYNPSLKFLEKVATALDTQLVVSLR